MGTQQSIANIALLVKDYDAAIHFFTKQLEFNLIQDVDLGDGNRWVNVMPKSGQGAGLVLTQAKNEQVPLIGKQAASGVLLFLQTNNFWEDYHRMKGLGVQFDEDPREESYATVAIFKDISGNRWDLIQPTAE